MRDNETFYSNVANLYHKYKGSIIVKQKEIVRLEAEIDSINRVITDLECILSDHGNHIFDHFEQKCILSGGENK